jgi:hypothetical protein
MLPELQRWLLRAVQSSRFCFPGSVWLNLTLGPAGTPALHWLGAG